MPQYQLAQLNIAKMKAPLDSPSMSEFVENLDRINTLAEHSEGFVWRLDDEAENADAHNPFGEEFVINMSVWKDVACLSNYAFKSGHVAIMRRRREWFERMFEAYSVLWWVPENHRPSIAEAKQRLEQLQLCGASPQAFTFRDAYPSPDTPGHVQVCGSDDDCPAS